MKLKDKVALVTGSSRGMGRGIALELAREGALVAVNYIGDEKGAKETTRVVQKTGSKASLFRADVSSNKQAEELIKAVVKEFGGIDILINNAGILKKSPVHQMTEREWDEVVGINLKGVFNCTKFAVPHMIRKKYGKIISISSVAGIMGNKDASAYAAAKAGVVGFTKSVAKELAPYKINVNAIVPGYVKTDMLKEPEKRIENVPLKRIATPEEIGRLAAFLCSEDSACITGQGIVIDGGLSLV